jgi:hypothetical protein
VLTEIGIAVQNVHLISVETKTIITNDNVEKKRIDFIASAMMASSYMNHVDTSLKKLVYCLLTDWLDNKHFYNFYSADYVFCYYCSLTMHTMVIHSHISR